MDDVKSTDLIEFLRRQRQSRQFTDEPVSDDDLEAILEVARWTGSSKNTQPWQFVVVTDPEIKREISKATQWTGCTPMTTTRAGYRSGSCWRRRHSDWDPG